MPGLREPALLESAVAAPQASDRGKTLLKDPVEIAAAYLYYLCSNHPFADGNKRVALAACLVFLEANGRLPDPDLPGKDIAAWETLVLDIAGSRINRAGATRQLKRLLGHRVRGK